MVTHVSHAPQKLQAIMDAQSNFKDYRAMLANSTPPVVPYLGIVLRLAGLQHPRVVDASGSDLTFLRDGGSDYILNGLANVSKWRKIIAQV